MSALPIFPGRLQPSIFGAGELNCRVRNGNGWTLAAINTDCVAVDFISLASAFGQSSLMPSQLLSKSKPLRWVSIWLARLCRTIFQPLARLKPNLLFFPRQESGGNKADLFRLVKTYNLLWHPNFPSRKFGDPWENRTPVCGVRGRRLNRLTNGPWCAFRDSNPGPTD